jgi:protein-disulfide isomerase
VSATVVTEPPRGAAIDAGAAAAPPAVLVADGDRPSRGAPDAPIVLVEYGDFECPYCAQAAPVLHELVESSGGLVRHVFRHFPVFQIHAYALTAALAAEVAHAQGRFWPMHDLMFAHQDRLRDNDLRVFARKLGMDGDLVVGDAAQPYGDAVEADYESGVAAGVRGTPTIFINGVQYRGRPELTALRRAAGISGRSGRAASSAAPDTANGSSAGNGSTASSASSTSSTSSGPDVSGDGPAGRQRRWTPWPRR